MTTDSEAQAHEHKLLPYTQRNRGPQTRSAPQTASHSTKSSAHRSTPNSFLLRVANRPWNDSSIRRGRRTVRHHGPPVLGRCDLQDRNAILHLVSPSEMSQGAIATHIVHLWVLPHQPPVHVVRLDGDAEGLFDHLDVLLHSFSDVGDEVADELRDPAAGQ